jgi:crotonobetainyl-CoA:carnitine CoA-transferase CaiB-like acyl-CoA transferase
VEAERHWPRLLRVLGREDLAADPRFTTTRARWEHAAALTPILDAAFAQQPLAVWCERFDREDLWWAPIQTPAEVVQDPQVHAAGAIVGVPAADGAGTVPGVASPVTFGSGAPYPRAPAPRLGEHTAAVLQDLGYTAAEQARLRADGVIG